MSVENFDESFGSNPAENYERYFVPAIGGPLAKDFVGRLSVRSTDRVLDVACGTGIVARLLAEAAEPPQSVAGLDLNAAMLAVARNAVLAPDAVQWYAAPAEQMPLPDASFDVVVCQMGLQFMADQPAALKEMWRVLADGGRLWLSLPGPTTGIFAIMADALARHVGPQARGFVTTVFSLHDLRDIERLLQEAGFQDVEIEATKQVLELPPSHDFLWQYVHSTPLTGVVSQASADARGALEEEVVNAGKEFERNGVLRHELRLVVAKGIKTAA